MNTEEIRHQVKHLVEQIITSGYSKTFNCEYQYVKPSKSFYHFQYFWDTYFHAFILVNLQHFELAKKSLRSLVGMQKDDGFIGHILYWNNVLPSRFTDLFQSRPGLRKTLFRPHMSNLIQPPIIAQAVLRIHEGCNDIEFVKEMVPKLKKYYAWLIRNRDFDSDGLLSIISYFEGGMDWKPSYDHVIGFPPHKANRILFFKVILNDFLNFKDDYDLDKIYSRNYFIVKDAGVNTIFAQNLKALSALCRMVNDPDAQYFEKHAQKVINTIHKEMYDEEDAAFYDLEAKTNKKLKVLTPTIFYPVVIKDIPKELGKTVIERHFYNHEEFNCRYPIPSLSINHPAFNPKHSLYIWRGPTWIIDNWFIHQFLLEAGFEEEATKVVKSIKQLIEKSGFREYYNPFTGEGYGAKNFTWSGLILDMIALDKGITSKEKRFI